MPVEPRPADPITRLNLFRGLPVVDFTPVSAGVPGTTVELGILAEAALQKELEEAVLRRGDSGVLTVDRKLVGSLEPTLRIATYKFTPEIAQLVLGSASVAANVADAAAAITNEVVTTPAGANRNRTYVHLANADVSEASFGGTAVTCGTITAEAVGTGQGGTFGETQGDFALDFKVLLAADVTSFTVGGVARTVVAGAAPAAGQVGVIVGAVAAGGELTFPSGEAPANGDAIVATYTPSFTFAIGTDYEVDPLLGRIRFKLIEDPASPGVQQIRENQPMFADYTYNRKASNRILPFSQTSFEGSARVRLLPDIGSNFIWQIPSVSLLLNDEDLTFSAEDFATATMDLSLNNAGGAQPYGFMDISSETEAAA